MACEASARAAAMVRLAARKGDSWAGTTASIAKPATPGDKRGMSLADLIRTIPDYPKPGIQFRDITTLLADARGFRRAVDELVKVMASTAGSSAGKSTPPRPPVVR